MGVSPRWPWLVDNNPAVVRRGRVMPDHQPVHGWGAPEPCPEVGECLE